MIGSLMRKGRRSPAPGHRMAEAEGDSRQLAVGSTQSAVSLGAANSVLPSASGVLASGATSWGRLPDILLVAALGVLLIALGDVAARNSLGLAAPLFWLGLVVLYTAAIGRMLAPGLTRREAIGLVLFLGLGTYLVKFMHSPVGFSSFDEFLHWRTANDIIKSGRLFGENPMLPASPLYPGLENLTVALAQMSGLSIFHAGVLGLGLARMAMVLALFLFYERAARSHRIAALAVACYMANPKWMLFDAQFAYESLALPLVACMLFYLGRRQHDPAAPGLVLNVLAGLGMLALVVTHHSTSYIFTGFLIIWAGVSIVIGRHSPVRQRGPGWLVPVALGGNALWLLSVATLTIGYLAPHLMGTVEAIIQLIQGEGADRQLFQSANGYRAPLLERLTALASVGLIGLLLMAGLWYCWRHRRGHASTMVLALISLSYPVTLVLRLTGAGWEVASRAAAFLFIAVAFVLAFGIDWAARLDLARWLSHWLRPGLQEEALNADKRGRTRMGSLRWAFIRVHPRPKSNNSYLRGLLPGLPALQRLVLLPYMAIVFTGGVITGWSPWTRMPWPYLVGAGARSIEPQGVAAAYWAREHLGPGNRMAADRTNTSLMGSYGEQRMIVDLIDNVSISGIFLSSKLSNGQLRTIRQAQIRYLVVDRRLSTALPMSGQYYESWERQIVPYTRPIPPAVLGKFSVMKRINLIFDSGDIAIYEIGALADAR